MSASRTVLLLLAASSLACASASGPLRFGDGQPIAPGRGEKIGIDQALLILDASSSMGGSGFATATSAAGSFVDSMPNGSYGAGSIVFGGSERGGVPVSSFSRSALKSSVANATHYGYSTPLADVLDDAYAALAGKRGDVGVVIFSDGVPTAGGIAQPSYRTVESALRLVRQRPDDRVCIHTVQVGNSASGAAILERLAGLSSCGSSRKASDLTGSGNVSSFARSVFFVGGAAPAPKPRPAAPSDKDRDGVVDGRDACPRTPLGASVNSRGCWVLKDLEFANDSAVVRSQYEPELDQVGRVLRENPDLRIRVEGHTDSNGPAAYNQALSERRAKSVHDYLVAAGIADERIDAVGKGEAEPIAPNDTPAGRAHNRRIKLSVLD